MVTSIQQNDLFNRIQQVLGQAPHRGAVIVAHEVEGQVALLDIVDYRLLRAVSAYHSLIS